MAWIWNKATRNIVLLELFPILVAVSLWGCFFANKRILVETDNKGHFSKPGGGGR